MSTFSERLKAARAAAGLTQRDLANRLDLTRGAIALWESDGNAGTTPRN
ncbi:MAG: helix-turn-helix transcriptional regulator, partial [Burkholderiaceae bacterium]